MKIAFVLLLVLLHGCNPVPPPKPPVLADGRWGEYNHDMTEQCAHASMVQGRRHHLEPDAIDGLFNQCVFDQGLTI